MPTPDPLDPEDAKIVTLARAARARTGAADWRPPAKRASADMRTGRLPQEPPSARTDPAGRLTASGRSKRRVWDRGPALRAGTPSPTYPPGPTFRSRRPYFASSSRAFG